jgi:addiction module HigA family antidote
MTDRIDPVHPGEVLFEDFLKPMGISPYRLSRSVHIDQTRISEVIRGKRNITADTALRLGKFFSTSPDFWLNMQNRYDLEKKQLEIEDDLAVVTPFGMTDSGTVPILAQ